MGAEVAFNLAVLLSLAPLHGLTMEGSEPRWVMAASTAEVQTPSGVEPLGKLIVLAQFNDLGLPGVISEDIYAVRKHAPAPATTWSSTEATRPVVRFDGVYQSSEKRAGIYSTWDYFRFFPDGTVRACTSVSSPDQVARWIGQDNNNVSVGRYRVEGMENVLFSTTSPRGTVDYEGSLHADTLHIRWHSHINGKQGTDRYAFVEIPATGPSASVTPMATAQKPAKPARLFAVRTNNLFGFIDVTGRVVIDAKFTEIQEFSEGLAFVTLSVGRAEARGPIDTSGHFAASVPYSRSFAFSEGLAAVEVKSKWGFIDHAGQFVIPPQFPLRWVDGQVAEQLFSEGLAAVRIGKMDGYIDKTGKTVIPPKFDYGESFWDGLAAVQIGRKWGFINRSGTLLVSPQYDAVLTFTNCRSPEWASPADENCFADPEGGLAAVRVGKKWGYINRSGKMVIPLTFDLAGGFTEAGLACVKMGNKYGYIDKTGSFAISAQWKNAGHFAEGLAPVTLGDKWGYINTTGELIIPMQFGFAHRFSGGLAIVGFGREGGLLNFWQHLEFGYIDKTGKYVWVSRGAMIRDQ